MNSPDADPRRASGANAATAATPRSEHPSQPGRDRDREDHLVEVGEQNRRHRGHPVNDDHAERMDGGLGGPAGVIVQEFHQHVEHELCATERAQQGDRAGAPIGQPDHQRCHHRSQHDDHTQIGDVTTGEHTISELEELFSITRSTVYRALARANTRATAG